MPKKYICVSQCPELDYDHGGIDHCESNNPKKKCPEGNIPIWQPIPVDTETYEDWK